MAQRRFGDLTAVVEGRFMWLVLLVGMEMLRVVVSFREMLRGGMERSDCSERLDSVRRGLNTTPVFRKQQPQKSNQCHVGYQRAWSLGDELFTAWH